ncbi:exoribonuclease II [Orbaceae bacterium ESL0727]|nr:exoribonuclease II [Orbaceae bacterium ESL0727]
MLQDNPLLAQLKQQLHAQTPHAEGIVRAHEKGFGFLDVDNKTSYFISVANMKNVYHGDKVSGTIISNNGKESFEPDTLIETTLHNFIAKVGFQNKSMVIYPENRPFAIRCKVNAQVSEHLKEGDWVMATLISHPLQPGKNSFFAEITQFIVAGNSPYQLWYKTLARYGLETAAPDYHELTIAPDEMENREDLTHIAFFTIDSENTQDMDDAISLAQDAQGNYQLMIAIADPTAYVLPNSALDNIAKMRNFTTYLPDFTIPMLPKVLANELCSLKAGQKRPVMICRVNIDHLGNILDDMSFMPAWIESKAKLSYSNVSDFLENQHQLLLDDQLVDRQVLSQQLKLLADLCQLRMTWRKNNALTFKDNGDYRFVFDENHCVKNIIKESRRIANRMVEEVMVIANQALTQLFTDKIGFGIFNTHSGFDSKYTEQILNVLHDNALTDIDKTALSSLTSYIQLRRLIDDNDFLAARLRKFQSPADFAIEPQPHFGLGFTAYATWTSPIRKYGDMVNHRLIKAFIRSQTFTKPELEQLKTMNERRKMLRLAERDMADALYTQYLTDKIGQTYLAEIIDINRGGARVRLLDIGAVAFMPLSMIHPVRNEIASFLDEAVIKINDEICYKLADQVSVMIHEVKTETQTIIVKLMINNE